MIARSARFDPGVRVGPRLPARLGRREPGAARVVRSPVDPLALDHDDVARAVAIGSDQLRNHGITLFYWRLGRRLAAHLGTDVANWCTWATWASRTVGHALDPYATPYLVRERTRSWPRPARTAALRVARWSRTALNPRLAPAIAVGNREIFDEIADHFLTFLDALDDGRLPDAASAHRFAAGIVGAEAPTGSEHRRMLDHHREGFVRYWEAAQESRPAERARLVLAGNLLMAEYEQARLQPWIEEAFFVAPSEGWGVPAILRRTIGPAVARLTTRRVTAVITPAMLVPVGEPLRRRAGEARLFPAALDPPGTELGAVLARYPSGPTPQCANWTRFEDRMAFVTGLFHAYHFEPTLHAAPFAMVAARDLVRALRENDPSVAERINRAARVD